jgi:hypothetical protein
VLLLLLLLLLPLLPSCLLVSVRSLFLHWLHSCLNLCRDEGGCCGRSLLHVARLLKVLLVLLAQRLAAVD